MISDHQKAQILRLYEIESFPIGTIARQLGLHHSTVRRVVERSGSGRKSQSQRPSELDRYLPFLRETLERFPDIPSSRLFQMVQKRGYRGGPDHFRHQIAKLRPRREHEAFLKLGSVPGEEAQVDWGHFGEVLCGKATRRLYAFVMVLTYSRAIHLRFFFDMKMASFLQGHQSAFVFFEGVPRRLLYDNLRSVVTGRVGRQIDFNPEFLRFSLDWRFEAVPVGVRRGNEKGRVERAIRFVRSSFWPACRFSTLSLLNKEAKEWCEGAAMDRPCPSMPGSLVRAALEKERKSLAPLLGELAPEEQMVTAKVAKWPFVRFDRNEYSVPHQLVQQAVVIRASDERVRIFDGTQLVAIHRRSFDKGQQIEDPDHQKALREWKRRGRKGAGKNRLTTSVPMATQLLEALAQRNDNIANATSYLLRLLDRHGAHALSQAIKEGLEQGAPSPQSIQHILERNAKDTGEKPRLLIRLPDRPEVTDLSVEMGELSDFDRLFEDREEDS